MMMTTDHHIRSRFAAPHPLHGKKNKIAIRTRARDVIAKTAFGFESLKVFVHRVASEAAWRLNKRPRPCPPPKSLPAELWIQIIEQESTCEEWIALAKTCRFFRQVAQPCLYKQATVGRYWSTNYSTAVHEHEHEHARTALDVFSRTIQRRPDLAASVRALTLHSPSRAVAREHELLHAAPAAWLTCLPTLETLRLTKYVLTPAFCAALRALPRLRLTRYAHCRASADLLPAYPTRVLSDVEISIPYVCKAAASPRAWTAVVPAGIASLALHTPGNAAYLELMLSGIMVMGGNARLTALSLGTAYLPARRRRRGHAADILPAALPHFLASAPLLRRLALNFWTSDASVLLGVLPADAVPLLEDFTGPPALFDVFLRGRPVRRVGAFFDLSAEDGVAPESLVPLALSAAPVTELALDVGLLFSDMRDVGACLLHAPGTVRRLTWSYVFAVDLLALLPALSRLKNLREIGGLRDYKLSAAEIVQIAAACPALCEVYTERHVWVRRCAPGDVWDRFSVGEVALC